jgi:hypothetical protein
VHAVVNRIRLKTPIDPEVFAAAQRELPPRAAQIEGLRAFHLLRSGEHDLIVIVIGDHQEAIERMRTEIGNDWMRAHVIPHAAEPPERLVGEAVVSFERD